MSLNLYLNTYKSGETISSGEYDLIIGAASLLEII